MITLALTGATGYVGQRLLRRLAEVEGLSVFAITSNPSDDFYWDIRTKPSASLIKKLRGVDILLHLAARLPLNYSDLDEANDCNEVNGLAVINIVELVKQANIKRVVYVSTANLLGRDINGFISNESKYDCAYAVAYFASKILGELYFSALKNPNSESLIVRPSSLYSEDKPTPFMSYVKSKILSRERVELYNGGRFTSDYLHVDDFVNVLVRLCLSNIVGELNVGTGMELSNLKIAQIACEVNNLNIDENIIFVSGGHGGGGFGPVLITDALTNLGFNPTMPPNGIKRIMSC